MKTLHIPDMSCGHCRDTVEKTIKALDADARIKFDMDARNIELDSQMESTDVQVALAEVGYPANPA